MQNDLISVIIPCYNVEKFIEKCIETIKKQTYKKIEVILVNDGSKDNTASIIKKSINNDKRFKYYYKKNGGAASARNYGIKKATGDYICFIDSDDYIEEDFIEELYNGIIENNSDICVCNFKRIYGKKNTINRMNNIIDVLKTPAPWNKIYKASLFKDYNIYFPEGILYEDLCAIAELSIVSKISYKDKVLYNYYQNPNSIMHIYDDRVFDTYKAIQKIEEKISELGIFEEKKDYLEFLNIYHILVGTIYRASYHKDFSPKMIKEITDEVNKKYPNWNKNKYIKSDFNLFYKLYLKVLNKRLYKMIYVLIKLLGRFLYL